jgi:hypothetical protein
LEKCVFAAPSLEILGHTILATGAAPTADHAAEYVTVNKLVLSYLSLRHLPHPHLSTDGMVARRQAGRLYVSVDRLYPGNSRKGYYTC